MATQKLTTPAMIQQRPIINDQERLEDPGQGPVPVRIPNVPIPNNDQEKLEEPGRGPNPVRIPDKPIPSI